MGVIDRSVYVIHCGLCEAHEEIRILDYGNSYSRPSWQGAPAMKFFTANWENSDGGKKEPIPSDWKCNKCGAFDIDVIGPTG